MKSILHTVGFLALAISSINSMVPPILYKFDQIDCANNSTAAENCYNDIQEFAFKNEMYFELDFNIRAYVLSVRSTSDTFNRSCTAFKNAISGIGDCKTCSLRSDNERTNPEYCIVA